MSSPRPPPRSWTASPAANGRVHGGHTPSPCQAAADTVALYRPAKPAGSNHGSCHFSTLILARQDEQIARQWLHLVATNFEKHVRWWRKHLGSPCPPYDPARGRRRAHAPSSTVLYCVLFWGLQICLYLPTRGHDMYAWDMCLCRQRRKRESVKTSYYVHIIVLGLSSMVFSFTL